MGDDKVIKITTYDYYKKNNLKKNCYKIFFGFLKYRLSFRNLKCAHFVIFYISMTKIEPI